MATWASKDPDGVQDRTYTIPLDEGDSVAAATLTKLSGDVVLDSQSRDANIITAWLSAGTDGETAVFRVAWETAGGREDDDIITIAILANNETYPLALTGYVKPGIGHFIARYPSFAAVERSTIQAWLTDAERHVDTSWLEGDYAPAIMAYAAHMLTITGLGSEAEQTSDLPQGITSMRIGTLGLSFDGQLTRDKASGALSSTRYGAEYLALLRRNKSGPRVAGRGTLSGTFYPYPMGAF
jgi:hypothetical protein